MLAAKRLSHLRTRSNNTVVVVLLVLLCAQTMRHRRFQHTVVPVDTEFRTASYGVLPEEEYLERLADMHGLTNLTRWQSWRIKSAEQGGREDRPVTDVHANFDSAEMQRLISLTAPNRADLQTSRRISLPTRGGARPEQVDAAEFLFGISTSYERVKARDWAVLRAWARWLTRGSKTSNGASLVLMLNKATRAQMEEVDTALREAGIEAYTTAMDQSMSMVRRYYELVRVLKTHTATLAANGQSKRWIGVVEDSIFFPSLPYLRERLAGYDAQEKLCIGLPSERLDWHEGGEGDSSLTTSGGGALVLTREAVLSITRLPCLEREAVDEEPVRPQRWDSVLSQCLEKGEDVGMHVIPAVYSPCDAPTGPLVAAHETGARPLVLHDYQSRHGLDLGMAHLVAGVCGGACFMQRYLFHDDWVLINGVSISQHPDGLEYEQLGKDKQQQSPWRRWRHRRKADDGGADADAADAAQGPPPPRISGRIVIDDGGLEQRAALAWTGRRHVWTLVDSVAAADGAVWQAYVKRGRASGGAGETEETDSVIVLVWEKDSPR